MAEYITRTFTGFNCTFVNGQPKFELDENGRPKLDDKGFPIMTVEKTVIYQPGTMNTKEQAVKSAIKQMAGKGILEQVDYVEEIRGVEVNEFFRISKPITRPQSQQKKPAVTKEGGRG